jgi:formiminotetrahydrofolate cyclodeaminase
MAEETIEHWITGLAAKQPTPGGGAAAALSAAMAAALLGMVSMYTTGPKWPDISVKMQSLARVLTKLRIRALTLMRADAEAFGEVAETYKMSAVSTKQKAEKHAAVQHALIQASNPPIRVIDIAVELLSYAEELAALGNPNVISDVGIAACNIRSAIESALINIEINRHVITDPKQNKRLKTIIEETTAITNRIDSVQVVVKDRIASA